MRHYRRGGLQAAALLILMLVVEPPQVLAAALGQREVLPNGMVLLFSEKRAVPILTATMLIQAGAIQDPSDKPGVANLTAELITQGTTRRTATQISEAIEFVGGSLSVGADQDVATVSFSVLSRDLDLGLDLLADILLNPTFAPEELKRKAQEVLAGIKRKQEDPGEVAAEAFAALVFGPHRYGQPVEGTEASVPTITREDVVRFHQANYRPNKAILAVVGDVSLPDLKRRLEARLGGWQPGGSAFVPPPDPAPLTRPVVRTIQQDVTQANILLGHLGVTRDNPDYYAIQVMNYILGGGGITSRLTSKIREEQGWAYDVRSAFTPDKYVGTFTVSVQTKNPTAQDTIDAILAEMRRIREQPVTETDLTDAKAYLTGSFPLRLDTTGKIVRLLANIEYFGLGLDYVDRYAGFINSVTVADIQRVARKYLHPDRYALAVVADLTKAKLKP
ncbi:MAG TPA: pitrilysin family protein [Candidatus Methylomirabilis sp.]|nr:pitrilysin family protein [Candidatus Methylomirabilis sp.]